MNGIHSQIGEMLDGPWLCECQELTRIFGIGAPYGEVAVVQFIDNKVGRRLGNGTHVAAPVVWIAFQHIKNSSAATIHAYGLCKDTCTLASPGIKGIELPPQVALYRGSPFLTIGIICHLNGLQGFSLIAVLVDAHLHRLGISRCKEVEDGGLGPTFHLIEECLSVCHICDKSQHRCRYYFFHV